MDREQERLQRIMALADADAGCAEMKRESELARQALESCTAQLPQEQRDLLWRYPGALYFLHHWTLGLVCRYMRFPDEKE